MSVKYDDRIEKIFFSILISFTITTPILFFAYNGVTFSIKLLIYTIFLIFSFIIVGWLVPQMLKNEDKNIKKTKLKTKFIIIIIICLMLIFVLLSIFYMPEIALSIAKLIIYIS